MTSAYSQDHHPTLRHPDREAAGTELQRVLVLLLDLQLTGKHAHWNVVGAPFRAIHLELDEFVAAWRDASDVVAERAAALGHPPDGRAGTVSATTQLPALPEGPLPGGALIDALIPILTEAVGIVRDRTDRIESIDVVTADLLHGVTATLEKQLWILRAQAG